MAPPANDAFASAQAISSASGTVSGTTFDATIEGSEPTIGVQTVWYLWTCPADGWYKFRIKREDHTYHGDFGFDNSFANLAVFPTGTLAQMTSANALAQSLGDLGELTDGWDVEIAFFATSAAQYYIKIGTSGSTNDATYDFDLTWTDFDPPANDNFADAEVVTSVPTLLVDQTTFDATFEATESKDNGFSQHDKEQSVWYKFTPPTTARYVISIPHASIEHVGHYTEGSSPNPEVNGRDHWNVCVQVGSGTTLATFQASELDAAASTELDTTQTEVACYVDLTAATDYYIRVYTHYSSKTFNDVPFNAEVVEFDLKIEATNPPANDNYADAEVLSTTVPNTLTATTRDATEEASEVSFPYAREQSIWYSFTPTISGEYRFRIKRDSLVLDAVGNGPAEVAMSMCPAAGLTNHIAANAIPFPNYTWTTADPSWQSVQNASLLVTLTASTEYIIKVTSNGGFSSDQFNTETTEFELEWEILIPPTNDDFDDSITITGTSGTEALSCLGATTEANEPVSYYWNDDGSGSQPGAQSIWYDWTCPASGWYQFGLESLEEPGNFFDLAIYTGAALNALTRINNAWAGSKPVAIAPRKSRPVIGINAVNGTTYRIQVVGWGSGTDDAQLVWSTLTTPTGDTAATAVVGRFQGLINNYGHTDNDLPPNAEALLSSHSEWWYNDVGFGKTKWLKYTAPQDLSIQITLRQWADSVSGTTAIQDVGLIAYKGADYASLVVAQAFNAEDEVLENVAMLMSPGSTFYDGDSYNNYAVTANTLNNANPIPVVDVAEGETIWICLFGLWDDDYAGDASVPASPLDAVEFDADLYFDVVPPPNDDVSPVSVGSVWGSPTYAYNLQKSEWGNYLTFSQDLAGQFFGTTFGATAQAGEQTHGGYGPTRSVWYYGSIPAGDTKIWVESDEDCVLSVYSAAGTHGTAPNPATLPSLGEDDDSGTGDWPEVIVNSPTGQSVWICIDSKVECTFTLKFEWVNDSPVIPANDNFDNAEAHVGPFVSGGTTIGAGGEYFETDSEGLGSGVTDTVWYKFTAVETKRIKIEGRVATNNNDGYVWFETYTGTGKDDLVRVGDPEYGGGIFKGPLFPNSTNDPQFVDVVNGTDYWIRVYTESGGSEEFELWVDTDLVYINIQASGVETGPWHITFPIKITPGGTDEHDQIVEILDSATVYVNLQVLGSDIGPYSDANTPYVNIQALGSDLFAHDYFDADTVLVAFEIDSHDCHTKFEPSQLIAHIFDRFETRENHRWLGTSAYRRFEVIAGDGLEEC